MISMLSIECQALAIGNCSQQYSMRANTHMSTGLRAGRGSNNPVLPYNRRLSRSGQEIRRRQVATTSSEVIKLKDRSQILRFDRAYTRSNSVSNVAGRVCCHACT